MILEKLSNLAGVSGSEDAVRELILAAVKPHVDDVTVDSMGNLIVTKAAARRRARRRGNPSLLATLHASASGASSGTPKVMLAAHMDEVGFMVTGHTGEGGIKFEYIGRIDDRVMPGSRVQLCTKRTEHAETATGVVGLKAIHLVDRNARERIAAEESLVIDVGATSKSQAEDVAPLGTYGTFLSEYRRLGNLVSGKAFDGRAGCSALVELLQGDAYPFDLVGVFTVQEEMRGRGAGIATHRIDPTCAFILATAVCDDLPKNKDHGLTTHSGHGPAIGIMDQGAISDRRLVDFLVAVAEHERIPYQFTQPGNNESEGRSIHQTREGVPTVQVGFPIRYPHSQVSVLDLRDYRNTVKLMDRALREL